MTLPLHIPHSGLGTTDIFWGTNSSTGNNWTTWYKPPSATFVYILCIGAGGSGGSGFSSATTNARGGGGGGGSGGITFATIPAFRLPGVLYTYAGIGAPRSLDAGGAASGGSFVSIAPSGASTYIVCSANAGGGGTRGTAAAAGTGGTAGAAAAFTNMLMLGGTFGALAGQAGAAGGVHTGAVGASITYPTTGLFVSGGAGGGGGASNAGGNVNPPSSQTGILSLFTALLGGNSGDPGVGGIPGVNRWPLISSGGTGGGASTTGTSSGGPGGDGGFGSGGGGGGAGFGSNTGGAGGPGVVVICAI